MTNAPTTRETADHAELARLAEAASKGDWWSDDDVISYQEVSRDDERFIYAFTPAVCSALLSEIAALRGERGKLKRELEFIKGVVTPDYGNGMTDIERVIFARISRLLTNVEAS